MFATKETLLLLTSRYISIQMRVYSDHVKAVIKLKVLVIFWTGHYLLSLQTFNPKTQHNAVLISFLIHLWNPIQWQKHTKVHQLTRPSCKVVNQRYLSFSLLVHGNHCAEQKACSFLYFTT